MSLNVSFTELLGDLPQEFFDDNVDVGLLTDGGAGFDRQESIQNCVGGDVECNCVGGGECDHGSCADQFIEVVKTNQDKKIKIIENILIRSADVISTPQQSGVLRNLLTNPKQPESSTIDRQEQLVMGQVEQQQPPKKKFKFKKSIEQVEIPAFMCEDFPVAAKESVGEETSIKEEVIPTTPTPPPPRKRLTVNKRRKSTPPPPNKPPAPSAASSSGEAPPCKPPAPSATVETNSDDDFSTSQQEAIAGMYKARQKLKKQLSESVLEGTELERSISQAEKVVREQTKLLRKLREKRNINKKQTEMYSRRFNMLNNFRFKE